MFVRSSLHGLIITLTCMLAVPPLAAQPLRSGDNEDLRAAIASCGALPLPRILAIARTHLPGDLLKVELRDMAGKLDYEVKILTPDGRLRTITLDARSGALIRIESN